VTQADRKASRRSSSAGWPPALVGRSRSSKMTLLRWTISTPAVRFLWVGRLCTYFAEQLVEVALVWLVWQQTGSSAKVGLTVLVSRAPFWLFLWLAGMYADRAPRRVIILCSNAAAAAIAGAIVLLFAFERLSYPTLMALTFLFAATRTLELPAVSAQLPDLVDADRVRSLNIVLDNTKRVGRLAAPLLASVLMLASPAPYLYAWAAIALLIATSCFFLTAPRAAVRQPSPGRFWQGLTEGWGALRSDRALLALVLCFAFYNPVYAISYWILLPRLFGGDLGQHASTYSLAVAVFAGGALISNLVVTTCGLSRPFRTTIVGFACTALCFAMLAFAPDLRAALLLVALAAVGIPLMDIGLSTLINERVDPKFQGRVFSLFRYLAEIGIAVGLAIGGLMADQIGTRWSYVAVGAYIAPVLVVFSWYLRRLLVTNEHAPASTTR
jgi:MFS transporter, DHA3 family, macrolide efflux protein